MGQKNLKDLNHEELVARINSATSIEDFVALTDECDRRKGALDRHKAAQAAKQ